MRRISRLWVLLLSVYHTAKSDVPDHFYCNIICDDASLGFTYNFVPSWGNVLSTQDAREMLPFDSWSNDMVSFRFPLSSLHEKLCSKMKATRPIYDGEETFVTVEVRGIGKFGGNSHVSMYRAARMRDWWIGTNHHLHNVVCFPCQCNALTPVPPQNAKTLDDIKAQLDSCADAEYNSRQYIDTWDGSGSSERVTFANAPFSQKNTTLGRQAVQLRYFWTFGGGNQQTSVQWPLDSIYNMGECRKACSDGYIPSSSASGCDICPSGKYASKPNAMSCTDCEAGKYSSTLSKTLSCEACPVGTYLSTTGNDSIEDCNACPLNSGNNNEASVTATSCICDSEFTRQNGQSCVQCLAGKYKPHTGDAACTNCTINQYSTLVGATSNRCEQCPVRAHAPTASNKRTNCMCNPGSSGPDGGPCLECLACKYKIGSGSAACTDCAEDRYSNGVGAITNACVA